MPSCLTPGCTTEPRLSENKGLCAECAARSTALPAAPPAPLPPPSPAERGAARLRTLLTSLYTEYSEAVDQATSRVESPILYSAETWRRLHAETVRLVAHLEELEGALPTHEEVLTTLSRTPLPPGARLLAATPTADLVLRSFPRTTLPLPVKLPRYKDPWDLLNTRNWARTDVRFYLDGPVAYETARRIEVRNGNHRVLAVLWVAPSSLSEDEAEIYSTLRESGVDHATAVELSRLV